MVTVAWGLGPGGWHRGSSDLWALDGIGGVWSAFLRTNGPISLTVVRGADVTEVIKQNLWQNHKNTTKNKVNDGLEKPLQLHENSEHRRAGTAMFGLQNQRLCIRLQLYDGGGTTLL